MKSILVTYDLVGTAETSADYARLIKQIKAFPNWARVAKSAWVLKTNGTPKQVRETLSAHMDGDDRLFVAELTGTAAWRNAMCRHKWLQQYL